MIDAAGSQGAVDQAFDGSARAARWWPWPPTGHPVQVGLAMTTNEVRFVASTSYGHHDGRARVRAAADVLAAVPDLPMP